jgi:L-seryl-tRNA(Ser) seleniumtransferase
MASYGVAVDGDLLAALRAYEPPVIARSRDDRTMLDLRSVLPSDDVVIVDALRHATPS